LAEWLAIPGIAASPTGPLFPAAKSPRGMGRDGFAATPMSTRAVEKLVARYVEALGLDPNVTVHSLRVTALTTARERGSDIIDLQDFAGTVMGPSWSSPRRRAWGRGSGWSTSGPTAARLAS
jgi:integrase/recombinase XerD